MADSPIHQNGPTVHDLAAKVIASGGVIAFRTDTFYGLGADPLNPSAVQRVRDLKGREERNPILLLISDITEAARFIDQSSLFLKVAARHWPGAITLVGRSKPTVPTELTANTQTLGVRLPFDEDVRALVRVCGGALTATSANPSGQPPTRTAEEVDRYFPTGLDLIIDGGEVTATEPSTVLDVSGPRARLIREGAVSSEQLKEFL